MNFVAIYWFLTIAQVAMLIWTCLSRSRQALTGTISLGIVALAWAGYWNWFLRDGLGPDSVRSTGLEALKRFIPDMLFSAIVPLSVILIAATVFAIGNRKRHAEQGAAPLPPAPQTGPSDGARWRWAKKMMIKKRQLVIACLGGAAIATSLVLWHLAPRWGGVLDFYPGVAYLGFSLLATVGVAKLKRPQFARCFAWVLRIANALVILIATFMIFLILPVNERRDASVLAIAVANGLLVLAAYICWWLANREIRRSLDTQ
jgi:hypothetical protein